MHHIRSRMTGPLAWALAALVLGTVLQIVHVDAIGSLEGTLRLGAEARARPFIEADFGEPLPLAAGRGHDGWRFYLTASDPLMLNEERSHVYNPYRFRRVLGPAVAGGMGAFSARATLLGLNIVGIAGFALVTGVAAALGTRLGARRWVPVAALLNVGFWLSVQLLSADTLTVGLALLAVHLALDRRRWGASVAMTLAVLAKDTSILFAIGLALHHLRKRQFAAAAQIVLVPIVVLVAWLSYVEVRLGNGFTSNGNLAAPFTGIIDTISSWNGADGVYAWLALAALVVAVVVVAIGRVPLITSLLLPWVGISIVSSTLVWEDGNNAIRALSPLWTLAVIGLAVMFARQDTPDETSLADG